MKYFSATNRVLVLLYLLESPVLTYPEMVYPDGGRNVVRPIKVKNDRPQPYNDGRVMANVIGSGGMNFFFYFYTLGVACENTDRQFYREIQKNFEYCVNRHGPPPSQVRNNPLGSIIKPCAEWKMYYRTCYKELALDYDECLVGKPGFLKMGTEALRFTHAYAKFICGNIPDTEGHLVDRFYRHDMIVPGVFQCFPKLQDRIVRCVSKDRMSTTLCNKFYVVHACFGKHYNDNNCYDVQPIYYMDDLFRSMSANLGCSAKPKPTKQPFPGGWSKNSYEDRYTNPRNDDYLARPPPYRPSPNNDEWTRRRGEYLEQGYQKPSWQGQRQKLISNQRVQNPIFVRGELPRYSSQQEIYKSSRNQSRGNFYDEDERGRGRDRSSFERTREREYDSNGRGQDKTRISNGRGRFIESDVNRQFSDRPGMEMFNRGKITKVRPPANYGSGISRDEGRDRFNSIGKVPQVPTSVRSRFNTISRVPQYSSREEKSSSGERNGYIDENQRLYSSSGPTSRNGNQHVVAVPPARYAVSRTPQKTSVEQDYDYNDSADDEGHYSAQRNSKTSKTNNADSGYTVIYENESV